MGDDDMQRNAHATKPRPRNQIEVIHTRVFAATPDGGNPCPVIPFADALTGEQMQQLARRFGLDTVFVLRSSDADIRLRYFVPDHEMGVSGHATVAAITVAINNGILPRRRCRVATISGQFEVSAAKSASDIVVTLDQNRPTFGSSVSSEEAANALNISKHDLELSAGPIQAVSVSRAKLLVPLRDWRVLNGLKPDFEAIWRCCDRLNVTGFYPFTRQTNKPDADVEARQFPLRAGFPEDAATGVAAGALGAYLTLHDRKCRNGVHKLRVAQGYAMGAPSLIEVITECDEQEITRVAIQGIAKQVAQERIDIGTIPQQPAE